jgi:hypothetical protein
LGPHENGEEGELSQREKGGREKRGWAGYLDWKRKGKRKFPFNDL